MTTDEREINRRRRILDHADESGNVAKICHYFGIPRSLFYVWRNAYHQQGDVSPEQSAQGLVARLDELTVGTTGTFWHANGEILPW